MTSQLVEQNYLYDVKDFMLTGRNIRVHGNGFIQVDLPENKRLHVWGHPDIPRQVESSQIHSHRFGFESTILVGSLVNVIYKKIKLTDQSEYSPSELFDVYVPVQRTLEDTVLVREEGDPICLSPTPIALYRAGDTYSMLPKDIHETFVNQPTATLMTKTSVAPDDYVPEVFLPLNKKPDNAFNRYQNLGTEELWTIVQSVLSGGQGKPYAPDFFYDITDTRLLVRDSKYRYVFYTKKGYCLGMYSEQFNRWNMKNRVSAWSEVGHVPPSATHYVVFTPPQQFGSFDTPMTDEQYVKMVDFTEGLNPSKQNLLYKRA